MEKDGQTRVYISGGNDAWEMFPEEKAFDDRLEDDPARKVLTKADFVCVNYETFEKRTDGRFGFGKQISKVWGVIPKPNGPIFDIDRMKIKREEEYSSLAKTLENRTGKKGLTIIVR